MRSALLILLWSGLVAGAVLGSLRRTLVEAPLTWSPWPHNRVWNEVGTLALPVDRWLAVAAPPLGRLMPGSAALRVLDRRVRRRGAFPRALFGGLKLHWERAPFRAANLEALEQAGMAWVRIEGGMTRVRVSVDQASVDSQVWLPDFELSRTEVTVGQYQRCVADGGCVDIFLHAGTWCHGTEDDGAALARNCVTRDDALRFATWAGARLPTMAELARAAVGDRHEVGVGLRPAWDRTWESLMCRALRSMNRTSPECHTHRVRPAPCAYLGGVGNRGLCGLWDQLEEWTTDDARDVFPPTALLFGNALVWGRGLASSERPYAARADLGFRLARWRTGARDAATRTARLKAAERDLRARAAFAWDAIASSTTASARWRAVATETWLARFGHAEANAGSDWRAVEVAELPLARAAFGAQQDLPTFPLPGGTVLIDHANVDVCSAPRSAPPVFTAAYLGSDSAGAQEPPIEVRSESVEVNSFELGRQLVTLGQYTRCVAAGVCSGRRSGRRCVEDRAENAEWPVNCVSLAQAEVFAQWVGARLPTEAEWLLAAVDGHPRAGALSAASDTRCTRWLWEVAKPAEFEPCLCPGNGSSPEVCDLAGRLGEWALRGVSATADAGLATAEMSMAPVPVAMGGGARVPAWRRLWPGRPVGRDEGSPYVGFRIVRD